MNVWFLSYKCIAVRLNTDICACVDDNNAAWRRRIMKYDGWVIKNYFGLFYDKLALA